MRLRFLPAIAIVLLAASGVSHAQSRGTIRGVVQDSAGPVSYAEISVVGSEVRLLTDEFGRFRLTEVPYGSVELRARRLGYTPATQTLQFAKGTEAEVEFILSPAPGCLPSVEVPARRQVFDGRLRGFQERSTKGVGHFITRERLDRVKSYRFSDLIRTVPGVTLKALRGGGTSLTLRGALCSPLVFVDGSPASAGGQPVDLDMFDLSTVEGIEIYPGLSSVPAEFITGRGGERCGVIAIWSRPYRPKPVVQVSRAPKAPALDSIVTAMSIFTVDQVDTPASLVTGSALPEYPDSLRREGVGGKVVIELVVNVDGSLDTASVNLVSSTHQLFTEAVQQALATAKFKPATLRARAVRQVLQVPFVFKAEKVSQSR